MGVVTVQSRNVCLTSYRLTSQGHGQMTMMLHTTGLDTSIEL